VLAALAVLSACSDGTSSTPAQLDTVAFSFSGDTSGSFSVSAERGNDALAQFQSGDAVVVRSERAATDSTVAYLVIDVLRPFGNGRYDLFSIWVPPQTGTHQVGLSCGPYFIDYAPAIQLGNFGAYDNARDRFYFEPCGSVTIDELSATRVRGRFSGAGTTDTGRDIMIAGGSFSVGAKATGSALASVCGLLGNCQ
jgi:hypothetical protein